MTLISTSSWKSLALWLTMVSVYCFQCHLHIIESLIQQTFHVNSDTVYCIVNMF